MVSTLSARSRKTLGSGPEMRSCSLPPVLGPRATKRNGYHGLGEHDFKLVLQIIGKLGNLAVVVNSDQYLSKTGIGVFRTVGEHKAELAAADQGGGLGYALAGLDLL